MIKISKSHLDEIIEHAKEESPNECCGILVGTSNKVSQVYKITNDAKSQYRYVMNPQQQFDVERDCRGNDLDMIAFYHSHTHSEAYPSDTDVRMALQSGWLGDMISYMLVSLEDKSNPVVKSYSIGEEGEKLEQLFQESDYKTFEKDYEDHVHEESIQVV